MPLEVSNKRQEPHFHRYEDLVRYYENFFEPGSTLSYTGKQKKKIASPTLPRQQQQQCGTVVIAYTYECFVVAAAAAAAAASQSLVTLARAVLTRAPRQSAMAEATVAILLEEVFTSHFFLNYISDKATLINFRKALGRRAFHRKRVFVLRYLQIVWMLQYQK